MKRTAKPRIANQDLLNALLGQAVQRRPYMSALALVTPGGQLMAAALPPNVEGETRAALAAPVGCLGRRTRRGNRAGQSTDRRRRPGSCRDLS